MTSKTKQLVFIAAVWAVAAAAPLVPMLMG